MTPRTTEMKLRQTTYGQYKNCFCPGSVGLARAFLSKLSLRKVAFVGVVPSGVRQTNGKLALLRRWLAVENSTQNAYDKGLLFKNGHEEHHAVTTSIIAFRSVHSTFIFYIHTMMLQSHSQSSDLLASKIVHSDSAPHHSSLLRVKSSIS